MTEEKNFSASHNSVESEAEAKDKLNDRRTKLIVAVVISMVFIIGAWLLTLPFQLRKIGTSRTEASRWQAVQAEVETSEKDFRATLGALRDSYDQLEQQMRIEEDGELKEAGNEVFPPEIAELLQNKLLETQAEKLNGAGDTGTAAGIESVIQ